MSGLLNGCFGEDASLTFSIFGSIAFYLKALMYVLSGFSKVILSKLHLRAHDPDSASSEWAQDEGKEMLSAMTTNLGIEESIFAAFIIVMYVYSSDNPALYWLIAANAVGAACIELERQLTAPPSVVQGRIIVQMYLALNIVCTIFAGLAALYLPSEEAPTDYGSGALMWCGKAALIAAAFLGIIVGVPALLVPAHFITNHDLDNVFQTWFNPMGLQMLHYLTRLFGNAAFTSVLGMVMLYFYYPLNPAVYYITFGMSLLRAAMQLKLFCKPLNQSEDQRGCCSTKSLSLFYCIVNLVIAGLSLATAISLS